MEFFSETTDKVLGHFQTDPKKGLSTLQVNNQRETHGRNELPKKECTPLCELILEQFKDQLVIILLLAAFVSLLLAILENEGWKGFVEPAVILLILIANATIGVIQESNAENAIEALKEYSPDECKVLRGEIVKLNATELVPGDIISVAVGDKIPADCRLLSILNTLRVDQSILTGESVSVMKIVEPVKQKNAVNQDKINMLFSGTTVVSGKANAIVTSTGLNTAIGNIHQSISDQVTEKTPLKKKLDEFGDSLARVISVICVLVWLINIRHFNDPSHNGIFMGAIYYFKIAVSLAVAAIPEGLSVVITTCLALGTSKMAKKNAIVRSLPSVETLGCTSVICSDKTGTLTTNKMTVKKVLTTRSEFNVEGHSGDPLGSIVTTDKTAMEAKDFEWIRLVCALCNDASVSFDKAQTQFISVGEPTEAALKILVEKLDKSYDANKRLDAEWTREATMEFSRDRKSMGVIVKKEKARWMMVKGAPESILDRCTKIRIGNNDSAFTEDIKNRILKKVKQWGEDEALRVLALAFRKPLDKPYDFSDSKKFQDYESDLTFVGLVGMEDPPREEVRDAIAKCREAGIRVIVMTGDNQNTAESICRQIGLFSQGQNLKGLSFTGRDFDVLTAKDQLNAARKATLFSRVEPSHKLKLVELLQADGQVVAMTGDGVNDAPALKKADIGIAMGTGTDVAKLASDMVLADDNFATIVSAVEEGRSIYSNTKQFIRYLISSNIGEVISIFLTVLLGMPEALIPVQLLWVNLVTDGLPATALGFNPPDDDIMTMKPRDSREPIVTRWLFIRYMVIGTYVGCATVGAYAWWYMFYSQGPQITFHQLSNFHKCAELFPDLDCSIFSNGESAATMSLSVLVVIEMLNALNSLSENASLFSFPPTRNYYLLVAITISMALHFLILYTGLSGLFGVAPLNWEEWNAVWWMSVPVIGLDEILKWWSRKQAIACKKRD